jgi:hypothetical protein
MGAFDHLQTVADRPRCAESKPRPRLLDKRQRDAEIKTTDEADGSDKWRMKCDKYDRVMCFFSRFGCVRRKGSLSRIMGV